ncbi:MAG: LpxI family protein, partial [Pseudomonadota bacterium]|nr:LpxI family protein [Pseudomonadota bacterium]
VEAFPGTDWMLRSLTGEGAHDGPRGGILFKAPKAGQDRRFDMPAIGVDTVRAAQAAGLDGIVLAAGGVMVLDAPAVIAAADTAGLFLWVRAA